MKGEKNTELNFLYLDDKYNKKENETLRKKKKKQSKKGKQQNEDSQVFSFDDEIVIGVTKLPKEQKNLKRDNKNRVNLKNKKQKSKVQNSDKILTNNGADKKSAPKKITKTDAKNNKKKSFFKWLIKWTILISALIAAIIFFMMSPLFNIVEINITGNSKISKETIISLSEIKIGDNIYKNNKKEVRNKIKQNAYIESVNIKRIIPNKLEITVKERTATYMLEYANSFAYINNQGYILEISDTPLDIPIIKGYTTVQEELQEGKRLIKEDLDKLETVLKIREMVQSNGITAQINVVDISNKQNYTLQMNEEKKTIYLGDASSLSNRMLYLKAALEDTKGLEGEIFVNGDLIKEKAFFRQK